MYLSWSGLAPVRRVISRWSRNPGRTPFDVLIVPLVSRGRLLEGMRQAETNPLFGCTGLAAPQWYAPAGRSQPRLPRPGRQLDQPGPLLRGQAGQEFGDAVAGNCTGLCSASGGVIP